MYWILIVVFIIIILEFSRRDYIKKNPTHKVTWRHLFRYLSKFVVPLLFVGAFLAGLLGYIPDNFIWLVVAILCFEFVWLSYENERLEKRIGDLEHH